MAGEPGTVGPLEGLGTHGVRDEQEVRVPITWIGLGALGFLDSRLNLPSDSPYHTGWMEDGVGARGVIFWEELVGEVTGLTILTDRRISDHHLKNKTQQACRESRCLAV